MKIGDTKPLKAMFKGHDGLVLGHSTLQARVVAQDDKRSHLWVMKHGIRLMELDMMDSPTGPHLKDHK